MLGESRHIFERSESILCDAWDFEFVYDGVVFEVLDDTAVCVGVVVAVAFWLEVCFD